MCVFSVDGGVCRGGRAAAAPWPRRGYSEEAPLETRRLIAASRLRRVPSALPPIAPIEAGKRRLARITDPEGIGLGRFKILKAETRRYIPPNK